MSTKTCNDARRDILIIGGGSMGLSTAWHLLHDKHNSVTICDFRHDFAPSRDVSKILRTDYPDPERMKEVMRSMQMWKNDPVFKNHYKRPGRVVAYSSAHIETLRGIVFARSKLGLPLRIFQGPELLQHLYRSEYIKLDLITVHNEDDAVVDWTETMKGVREDCLRRGGRFLDDRVVRMEANVCGRIESVVTSTSTIDVENSEIILAAGPWIMKLLEDSAMQQPPTSRVPVATGIFSFSLKLSDAQWKKYSSLPVISIIGIGEFLCHPQVVGSAKLTWIIPFRSPSGEKAVSTPWDASDTDLAIKSMLDARDWLRQVLPDLRGSGARIQSVHSWWDGVTENQKPIITRHPQHPNLVIAGGCSYTHAKDLPCIGETVHRVLNGTGQYSQFGWAESIADRRSHNQPVVRTEQNFEDLELEASKDERVLRWKETRSDWDV